MTASAAIVSPPSPRYRPLRLQVPLLALAISASLSTQAQTQTSPNGTAVTAAATLAQPAAPSADDIRRREQELEATRAQQKRAAELAEKLRADIAAIGQDRSRLNQELIDIAGRVRGVETEIGKTEANLQSLGEREAAMRGSLDRRRSEVVEVLAALQRAGRRAPPALFVRPEDALQSLRTAMLFGAVVPEMRARADRLVHDLSELVAVRRSIVEERDRLSADRDRLNGDQTRLAALVEERQRQQSEAEKNVEAERQRALTLSRQADTLQDLIAKMERDLSSAARAAAAAMQRGAPGGRPNLAALKDPGRLSPAIAFASIRGQLGLPVNGTKIRDFGGTYGGGGPEKGISLTTKPGAQVTTPCDGWVVYAGPFRSYGQLLILNAGGGYHVLIAGMERITVSIGQFVLTGEPVATMGSTSQVASVLAATPNQPILYVEFRKDGTPIDSGPWWAASEGQKVRG